jgi:Matrixin
MKLATTMLLGLAASLAIGCGKQYGDDYTVYIDPKFTPLEVELIHTAGDEWVNAVEASGHHLVIRYVIGDCYAGNFASNGMVCLHYSSLSGVHEENPGYAGALINADTVWYYGDDSANTWIAMDEIYESPLYEFTHTVAHEMGHAMGLNHLASGLMYWRWNDSNANSTVSAPDVNQYLYLRGLSDVPPDYYH